MCCISTNKQRELVPNLKCYPAYIHWCVQFKYTNTTKSTMVWHCFTVRWQEIPPPPLSVLILTTLQCDLFTWSSKINKYYVGKLWQFAMGSKETTNDNSFLHEVKHTEQIKIFSIVLLLWFVVVVFLCIHEQLYGCIVWPFDSFIYTLV